MSSARPERSGRSRSSCSRERGYENVRAFASARSAGTELAFGDGELVVEEATPEALGAGDVDLFLFSVGTSASRELVPVASAAGAMCIDKSSAYRLVDGYPLVVPEVNPHRALEALDRDRIVANPNCCTIPLTCVLKPLHDEAGLRRVHIATYQSVSGAGAQRMQTLAASSPAENDLVMDWSWEGDESDEESKLRAETRKILELPELPISATCVRVPVMVGHSEAVWVEFERAAHARARDRDPAGRAERPGARAPGLSRPRRQPRAATRCSSGASAATRLGRTGSRSTSRATTSARAPRSTRSRSPSCCSEGVRRRASELARTAAAGAGAGAGVNASWTTRSTRARRPSSTGCEPTELQPAELDPPATERREAEVVEEVRGKTVRWMKNRSSTVASLVGVGERLDRLGAAIASLSDRGEHAGTSRPTPRLRA